MFWFPQTVISRLDSSVLGKTLSALPYGSHNPQILPIATSLSMEKLQGFPSWKMATSSCLMLVESPSGPRQRPQPPQYNYSSSTAAILSSVHPIVCSCGKALIHLRIPFFLNSCYVKILALSHREAEATIPLDTISFTSIMIMSFAYYLKVQTYPACTSQTHGSYPGKLEEQHTTSAKRQ